VSADGSRLRIEEALSQGRGGIITKAPKTEAGRRTVSLPAPVAAELARHLETFVDPSPDALVFPGPLGGVFRTCNFGTVVWRPALRGLGIEGVHFHDLRGTGATFAAQAGATIAELQARLGHRSPAAAMRYQHAAADRDRQLADRMAAQI
jgi:integrase